MPAPTPVRNLADLLLRWRYGLLAAAMVLALVSIPFARRLSLDQSIEGLFAPDDPLLADYRLSKKWFGGEQLAVVAYTDPHLFSAQGKERLLDLVDDLKRAPGVVQVGSLADLSAAAAAPDPSRGWLNQLAARPMNKQVANPGLSSEVRNSSGPVFFSLPPSLRELARGVVIGDDDQTTAALVSLEPEESTAVPRSRTIADLRAAADRHSHQHGLLTVVAGIPVLLHDVFRYVEQDGWRLGYASTGLLVLVILVLFRSVRWVVLPVLVVQMTLLWTKALLVLVHVELSMVSTMLAALVTVIGVATAVHITMRFRELRADREPLPAMRETICRVGPACFWTCLTTAAGFAALMVSRIHPVRSFGLMLALGALLVMVAAGTVIPGGAIVGGYGIDPHTAPGERRLGQWLQFLMRRIERQPGRIGFLAAGVFLLAGVGFFRLRVETDFTKNFRASSPIVGAYEFFEDRLGGAGNWEVIVSAPRELEPRFDEKLRRLSDELRRVEGITKVLSLADLLESLRQQNPLARLLPTSLAARLIEAQSPEQLAMLWNRDAGKMRILLRSRERQSAADKRSLITRVEELAQAKFPEARVSGSFVLLTYLIESLMRDQLLTFALATVAIALMLAVALRSVPLALVALVPNACPILVVIGVMGWLGLPINMATAMIASVSMGLAVDFSIHYLMRYQQERAAGADFYEALYRTHQSVGRALVLASVALVAGFSVLCLSNFIPTVHFGILVSVAMLGGLAGNLVLLPLLLTLLPGQRRPIPSQ